MFEHVGDGFDDDGVAVPAHPALQSPGPLLQRMNVRTNPPNEDILVCSGRPRPPSSSSPSLTMFFSSSGRVLRCSLVSETHIMVPGCPTGSTHVQNTSQGRCPGTASAASSLCGGGTTLSSFILTLRESNNPGHPDRVTWSESDLKPTAQTEGLAL